MLYYALLYGSNMPETVYTQVTGSEPSFMDEPVDSGLLTYVKPPTLFYSSKRANITSS